MADQRKPQTSRNLHSSSSSSSSNFKLNPTYDKTNDNLSQKVRYPNPPEAQKIPYPNPPDAANPDPATLREQWRFASKKFSRWYSQAWGTAILAGLSFFAVGWIVKGSNPLPSFKGDSNDAAPRDSEGGNAK